MNKALILAAFALVPIAAEAQTYVEVRGGATIGSYSSSRAGLDLVPEMSLDVLLRRTLGQSFAVYAAVSRLHFGCEEEFCRGSEPTIVGTHAVAGTEVRWREIWARGGVMYGTASMNTVDGAEVGFGMQGAAGYRFNLYGIDFLPGLSLERMQARTRTEVDWATAISLDLGLAYPLGF